MIEHSSIIVGKHIITASSTVTNLGVVLDRNLTMAYQVSKIVRICTYKLRLVNIIRDKLSVHVAVRVVKAMVTGNLGYCNSLLPYNHCFICLLSLCKLYFLFFFLYIIYIYLYIIICMILNTCNFIKRIEQVLVELDISAIEDYVIIIIFSC